MRSKIVTVAKLFAILLGSALLGYILLIAALKIPVNPNTVDTFEKYAKEMGWCPLVNNRYTVYTGYFNTFEPGVLDDITDGIIISKSISSDSESIPWQAAYMQGYGRYWQGYIILLRPLFYFFSVWDVYLLNGLAQLSIAVVLCLIVFKATGKMRYSVAAASSYLLLMPVALMSSFQFSPVFYIAFIGSIVMIATEKVSKDTDRLLCFFLVMGILTSYFDFLTYPLLTWAMPLCWFLVIRNKGANSVKSIFCVIKTALSWVLGYVGMFLLKWLLLLIVCGKEAFVSADTGEAFFHLQGLSDTLKVSKETYSRFDVLFTNWRHYMFAGYAVILIAWIGYAIYKYMTGRFAISKAEAPLLLITLSSPAWYLVFITHTAIHHFFTYRIYVASILAFLLLICEVAQEKETEKTTRQAVIKRIIVLAISTSLGLVVSFAAKENVSVISGGDYQTIRLSEGDSFSVTFCPTFGNVKQFGLCFVPTDDLNGYCNVSLSENGEVLYKESFLIADYKETTYDPHGVDWKLKAAHEYQLSVEVKGNKSGIDLFITPDGLMPLNEYRNVLMNGANLEAVEPLGGLIYNTPIRSRSGMMYLTLLVGAYFLMAFETVHALCCARKRRNYSLERA